MKKISTFFLFVSIGINSYAQEIKQERTAIISQPHAVESVKKVKIYEPSSSKPITISKKGNEPQVTHDQNYYLNEIEKIDKQISDINTKISFVNNDPIEKTNATNSGWFDDMERVKSELGVRKSELQNHLN